MTATIVVAFEDFKKLIKDKRLYYYIGEDFFEFHFLAEGMIVKSGLLKSEILNLQQFFSDKIFYNSVELKFRIPNPKTDFTEIDGIRRPLELVLDPVLVQDAETRDTDLQREGVDDSLE
jgi:hypothetical protein